MIDYYMEIARSAGKHAPPLGGVEFPLAAEEKEFATAFDIAPGSVGIPLGSRYGPAKRWPDESVKEFVRMVTEKTERTMVLFGTSEESGQAAELASDNTRVINLAGKTSVGEMAAVMDRCDWIVANDSGPLHVAAALGKKTIAIFGPTDPNRTAPLSERVTIVRQKPDCAPCLNRVCLTDHICMKEITAQMVLDVIQNS
jgi:heptosyltransferase-2